MLSAEDLQTFPTPDADFTIPYGDREHQFGELRLPANRGPHATMVLIHGGCWLAEYDIAHIRNLAAEFTKAGIATWTLEYRRVGHDGGGWPGTFHDVAAGAAHLSKLASTYDLDLSRTITAGHSAGGQLALWLAAVPTAFQLSELKKPTGVLALAPAADLAHLYRIEVCDGVVGRLMDGSPEERPDRYAAVSPIERVRSDVRQRIVLGDKDETWTPVGQRYAEVAHTVVDDIKTVIVPDCGHFEMIDPRTPAWTVVLDSALDLLDQGAVDA